MPMSPTLERPISNDPLYTGLAWCLAWEQIDSPEKRQSLHTALLQQQLPTDFKTEWLSQIEPLQTIPKDYFPHTVKQLQNDYSDLWNLPDRVGLVYGGATKIKQYVYETNKLQEIRGASALLDRINLVDLPAFFYGDTDDRFPQCQEAQTRSQDCQRVRQWLQKQGFNALADALIPQLIIYASGGAILALCPASLVDDLANAIERRYADETLIANACAVGDRFHPLELRFGKLPQENQPQFWLNDYLQAKNNPVLQAYFDQPSDGEKTESYLIDQFKARKTFNELVTQLSSQFNQRRGGYDATSRPARSHPPLYETHPYLMRDDGDRRPALGQVEDLRNLKFSEPAGRKYIMGQQTKRQTQQDWWPTIVGDWHPGHIDSWVQRFCQSKDKLPYKDYFDALPKQVSLNYVDEARSLREIGAACSRPGFVGYIYADGNNIGGYIQKAIRTPEAYQRFSRDISEATEQAVYRAIAKHLKPFEYKPDADSERKSSKVWIHPFEILTIGGDDVFLVVPADRALAVVKTISEEFETLLWDKGPTYQAGECDRTQTIHRYRSVTGPPNKNQSVLSMSSGVLLAADNTPIYYAQGLVEQLQKSAKKKAKNLRADGYLGGTVDFLVMKNVTMISSNLSEFRTNGLTKPTAGQSTLKLYGSPYTLYELGGLLNTAKVLEKTGFPKSQLYKIRDLLDQGKRAAMLNYRYFRVQLGDAGNLLKETFEDAWCQAKTNGGNLAPWMSLPDEKTTTYETIWRELVDLMFFITEESKEQNSSSKKSPQKRAVNHSKSQNRSKNQNRRNRRSRRR
ncbi:MAG: type III-B CRISPR-associated protein Cas10/Cmr2 [Cyanobacteria bacterium P01_H01_bin.21]